MTKIGEIDIPSDKRLEVSLTYIFGVGTSRARQILAALKLDKNMRAKELTPEQINNIQRELSNYTIEGELRREVTQNIQRLVAISCYRGIRHREGLPVRGQNSRNKGGKRRDKRRRRAR